MKLSNEQRRYLERRLQEIMTAKRNEVNEKYPDKYSCYYDYVLATMDKKKAMEVLKAVILGSRYDIEANLEKATGISGNDFIKANANPAKSKALAKIDAEYVKVKDEIMLGKDTTISEAIAKFEALTFI